MTAQEYHNSHYVDGKFTPSEDFVDANDLLAKAKLIEDQVLRGPAKNDNTSTDFATAESPKIESEMEPMAQPPSSHVEGSKSPSHQAEEVPSKSGQELKKS